VVKENEERMQADVVESIRDVARLHYFSEAKIKCVPLLFFTFKS
jgi:hypothetical protein